MKIKEKQNLAKYTTFNIGGDADYFCAALTLDDVKEAVAFAKAKKLPTLVLGGGSNMLISDKGFKGLVIDINLKGWEAKQTDGHVWLRVSAGEDWDNVVEQAVKKGWWGIENLSHIPGKTGAIAVQNVGAYGQEASHVIETVTVLEKSSGQIFGIDKFSCNFSYRKSIFNSTQKNKFIILDILFKLSKIPRPNLWYRDLNLKFLGKKPSLPEIRKAVIEIRDKKFPFPDKPKCGNAGSFFKNVILDKNQLDQVAKSIEKNLGKQAAEAFGQRIILMHDHVKIPSAFLMELCGLKGFKTEKVKINENQPLVIINHSGKAKAADVLALAKKVISEVHNKTGLRLEIEPELIGFTQEELKRYAII